MLTFRHASRSDQGRRKYQEDSEAVWPGQSQLLPAVPAAPPEGVDVLAVLADGMGGHAAGDVASATICRTFHRRFLGGSGSTPLRLATSLQAANEAVHAATAANPSLGGMGATCVGIAVGQAGVHWISVGDSPLWRFRQGRLDRLNDDHSLAPMLDSLVAEGQMTPEEAAVDPRRHYLRSAVTGDELDLVDASREPLPLAAGDIVLLASDGVLTLTDSEIAELLNRHQGRAPGDIADALVHAVLQAGDPHQDNTTVVVLKAAQA
jgi:serine/threonine protein phosphatase PrpC